MWNGIPGFALGDLQLRPVRYSFRTVHYAVKVFPNTGRYPHISPIALTPPIVLLCVQIVNDLIGTVHCSGAQGEG